MPIIIAIQEAELRIAVQSQPVQTVLSRKYPTQNRAGGMA
jgi:hypothetical protein